LTAPASSVGAPSMIANFTFGNCVATFQMAFCMRKPTPITRSYLSWAYFVRFGT